MQRRRRVLRFEVIVDIRVGVEVGIAEREITVDIRVGVEEGIAEREVDGRSRLRRHHAPVLCVVLVARGETPRQRMGTVRTVDAHVPEFIFERLICTVGAPRVPTVRIQLTERATHSDTAVVRTPPSTPGCRPHVGLGCAGSLQGWGSAVGRGVVSVEAVVAGRFACRLPLNRWGIGVGRGAGAGTAVHAECSRAGSRDGGSRAVVLDGCQCRELRWRNPRSGPSAETDEKDGESAEADASEEECGMREQRERESSGEGAGGELRAVHR